MEILISISKLQQKDNVKEKLFYFSNSLKDLPHPGGRDECYNKFMKRCSGIYWDNFVWVENKNKTKKQKNKKSKKKYKQKYMKLKAKV